MITVNKLCSVTYTKPTRGMPCLPIRRTFCWSEVWDYWYHIQRDTSLWCLMLFHGNKLDNLFCWRFQFLPNSMFSFSTSFVNVCCFVMFICIDMILAVVVEKSRLCDIHVWNGQAPARYRQARWCTHHNLKNTRI